MRPPERCKITMTNFKRLATTFFGCLGFVSSFVFLSFCLLSVLHSCLFLSFVFCLLSNYRLKERGGGGLRSSRVVAKIRFRTFLLRRTSAPVRCGRQVSKNILPLFNQVWILFVFSMGLVDIYLTMF